VQKYCDKDALSNYIQVSKLGQLLVLVPGIIASVVFPYSIDDTGALSINKLQAICRIVCFVFIVFAAGVIATGYWVLPWIFGKGFGQMYTVMLCYLPGFLALSITVILSAYIAGKGMQRHNAIAAALALIIMLTGDILLIPNFGINAAALVSSLAYITCMVYALVLLHKKAKASVPDFFAVKRADISGLLSLLRKDKIE
jgi:O-antigen/teichoic acid export membrane protein